MCAAKTGYANGSDVLVNVAGKVCGHSTSHDISYKTNTKSVAVKPPATVKGPTQAGFSEQIGTEQSITLKVDGLKHYQEAEGTLEEIRAAWFKKEPVEVKAFMRDEDSKPYLVCDFLITDLQETAKVNEEVTYSFTAVSSGAPKTFLIPGSTTPAS